MADPVASETGGGAEVVEDKNEMIEQERESLRMIFPDECSSPSFNEFVFTLRPKSLAVAVKITFKLPHNYPEEVPLVQISFPGRRGTAPDRVLKLIEIAVESSARKYIGNPMMFELVEEVRSRLEEVKADLSLGAFSVCPHDMLGYLISFIRPFDIIRLGRTCQVLHRLTEEPRVWAMALQNRFNAPANASAPSRGFKNELFFRHFHLEPTDRVQVNPWLKLMQWHLTVMERLGLPDPWPTDPPPGGPAAYRSSPWMSYFTEEMSKVYNFIFELDTTVRQEPNEVPDRSGLIFFRAQERIEIAKFRFYTMEEMQSCPITSQEQWYWASRANQCPYLGNCFGMVTFNITNIFYLKPFLTAAATLAKGALASQNPGREVQFLNLIEYREATLKAAFTRRVEQVQVQPMHEPKKKKKPADDEAHGEAKGKDEEVTKRPKKKGNPIFVDKAIYTPTRVHLEGVYRSPYENWDADIGLAFELIAPHVAKCKYVYDIKNGLSKAKKSDPTAERFRQNCWMLRLPSIELLEHGLNRARIASPSFKAAALATAAVTATAPTD